MFFLYFFVILSIMQTVLLLDALQYTDVFIEDGFLSSLCFLYLLLHASFARTCIRYFCTVYSFICATNGFLCGPRFYDCLHGSSTFQVQISIVAVSGARDVGIW